MNDEETKQPVTPIRQYDGLDVNTRRKVRMVAVIRQWRKDGLFEFLSADAIERRLVGLVEEVFRE